MRIPARAKPTGAHAKAARLPATAGVIAVGAAAASLATVGITLAATHTGQTRSQGQGVTHAQAIPKISPGIAATPIGKGAGGQGTGGAGTIGAGTVGAGVARGVDGSSGGTLNLGASGQFKTTVTTSGAPSPGIYYVTASVSVTNPSSADQVLCAVRSGTFPFGGSVQAGQPQTISGTDKVTLAAGEPVTLLCESKHATAADQTQIAGMVTAVKVG
jgi:hypothetical protein